MDKDRLLQAIRYFAAHHLITADELLAAFNAGTGTLPKPVKPPPLSPPLSAKHMTFGSIMYYIGGLIVVAGITVLITGSWERLNIFTRILATMGAGITAYTIGELLRREKPFIGVSQAFYLISALVMPIGWYVVLGPSWLNVSSSVLEVLIPLLLLAVYGGSFWRTRNPLFLIFTILYGTWLFFGITDALVGTAPLFTYNFYLYRVMVVGLSYILLGYYFSDHTPYVFFEGWLYGFGVVEFLSAALVLTGFYPQDNLAWELLYPCLVMGILYLSVIIKSRAFLVWGAIFLMAYIVKVSAEFFHNSFAWPLALVICGLAFIGIGYATVYVNRSYLKASS